MDPLAANWLDWQAPWLDMLHGDQEQQGHTPLDTFIHGLCWDRSYHGQTRRTYQVAREGRSRWMEQPRCPQFPYCPVPEKAASINTKGKKNPCIFYAEFQNNCLANVKRVHTALLETQLFFSLGFMLMSQAGRCRSHKPRWWSRPQETMSFSRLKIINVSITCLIRWLKFPTKCVSRDVNSEKEDSSEIKGLCFGLFGVVLFLPFKLNSVALLF